MPSTSSAGTFCHDQSGWRSLVFCSVGLCGISHCAAKLIQVVGAAVPGLLHATLTQSLIACNAQCNHLLHATLNATNPTCQDVTCWTFTAAAAYCCHLNAGTAHTQLLHSAVTARCNGRPVTAPGGPPSLRSAVGLLALAAGTCLRGCWGSGAQNLAVNLVGCVAFAALYFYDQAAATVRVSSADSSVRPISRDRELFVNEQGERCPA